MALQPETDRAGRWADPTWTGDTAATFAVVIGVSRYHHLHGDDATYGLDQLSVSALTAFRFFEWLRDRYRLDGQPLVRCWLLLSPTEAERAWEPGLASSVDPTLDNCQSAIHEWYAEMRSLHPFHSKDSRALFFFSGHGLEFRDGHHLLLPSDYLRGAYGQVDHAMNVANLYHGLRDLPLAESYFFVDACREDHAALRELMPEGRRILNRPLSYRTRPDLKSAILYASGPGAAAWQPTGPEHGMSVFGQALVEALGGKGGFETRDARHFVNFRHIDDYVGQRVGELLASSDPPVKQPVKLGGERLAGMGSTAMCELRKAPVPRAYAPRAYALEMLDAFTPISRENWTGPSTEGGFDESLRALPNEFLTQLLWNASVVDLQTGEQRLLREHGREWLTLGRVSRHARLRRFSVVLRPTRALWLEFHGLDHDTTAACVLPDDDGGHVAPLYTMELDYSADQAGYELLSDLNVVLSPANVGPLARAARLWSRFKALDVADAPRPEEADLLEDILRDKRDSPLGATVAALLLSRVGRDDLLHDWVRNLTQWFPSRPDPCVVLMEQQLRFMPAGARMDLAPLFMLESRGLPHTAEALSLAARHADDLRDLVAEDDHERLAALRKRLRSAIAVFRPGGLCATFIGPKDRVNAGLMGKTIRRSV
jgi:Caspase domain